MNSILIESNRVIADSQIQTNKNLKQTSAEHSQVDNNASWRTTIDSGIQISEGDQISLEAAALNLNGAGSGNFQQFNGKVDVADTDGAFRKDNEVTITIAYYTTNNIEFNFPLPSGKHTVELNSTLQNNYGSPSLDGRNLWRISYPAFAGSTLQADHTILPSIDAQQFYLGKSPKNNPQTFRQDKGGYFFVGMDYATFNVPLWGALPFPGGPTPIFSQSMAESQAYVNWLAMTNFQNPTGIQFGQAVGPLLPLTSAPGYDTTVPDQTWSTLNMNVDIKNKFSSGGYFPNGYNGGANPLLILGGNALQRPLIPCSPGPPAAVTLSSGGTCQNIIEFETLGPHFYSYVLEKEPGIYKGSHFNNLPSQNKLYQPRKDADEFFCRGPFYDKDMNDLRPFGTVGADGDPAMGGMLNFNNPAVPFLQQKQRMPSWWSFQTEEIKISLKNWKYCSNSYW